MNLLTKSRAHIARRTQLQRAAHSKELRARAHARADGFNEALRRFGAKPDKQDGIVYLNQPPVRERMAVGIPGYVSVTTAWFEAVQYGEDFDCIGPGEAIGDFVPDKLRVRWWTWRRVQ